jgi:tol-pal system protein YbgF
MKMKNITHPLLAASLSVVLLGACAPSHNDAPAPLNTPADMWAELENTKGELRRINAKLEDLSQQVQNNKSDPELPARVNRLDGQVHRMASQLNIDLGDNAAAQPAAPQQAAPQAGYAQQPQAGYAAAAGGEDESAAAPQQPGYQQAQPAYPQQAQPAYQQGYQPPQTGYQQAQPAYQAPAAAPAAAPSAESQNPADALYAKGLASFNARQYQQALGIFQEFTRNFKTSPLMPNSLFWTGECYFQLGDFANAALSYQEIIEKYPKSAKHPDALFKRGAAFMKLGNAGAAKLSFKEVIDKYPTSAFAARAKAMMPK